MFPDLPETGDRTLGRQAIASKSLPLYGLCAPDDPIFEFREKYLRHRDRGSVAAM
jgi:hypothetical protein